MGTVVANGWKDTARMEASPQKTRARIVVVSPVRDEAQHIEQTLRSMELQTVRPIQWVIVNDGSTDGRTEIVGGWASQYHWISVVHRPDRGKRVAGSGVIEAFSEGLSRI